MKIVGSPVRSLLAGHCDRKPMSWAEVSQLSRAVESDPWLQAELAKLPVVALPTLPAAQVITQLANGDFIAQAVDPEDGVTVLLRSFDFIGVAGGQVFYVNTEGYDYARYAVRLAGLPRAPGADVATLQDVRECIEREDGLEAPLKARMLAALDRAIARARKE